MSNTISFSLPFILPRMAKVYLRKFFQAVGFKSSKNFILARTVFLKKWSNTYQSRCLWVWRPLLVRTWWWDSSWSSLLWTSALYSGDTNNTPRHSIRDSKINCKILFLVKSWWLWPFPSEDLLAIMMCAGI